MIKPIVIRTRVTKKEYGLLRLLAQREDLNASEFVRLVIHEAAKARGIPAVGLADLPVLANVEVQHGQSR